MAKKKSNFWTGIKNLALIIICFGVLSVFYKGATRSKELLTNDFIRLLEHI